MVVDFGGGTLDTSIIDTSNNQFNVKAFMGDYYLGGGDIDIKIMEDLIRRFQTQTGIDLNSIKGPKVDKAKAKLR